MQTSKLRGREKKPQKTATHRRSASQTLLRRTAASHPDAIAGCITDALLAQQQGASIDLALTRALKKSVVLSPLQRGDVVGVLRDINRHRARLRWHLEKEHVEENPENYYWAWVAMHASGTGWGSEIDSAKRRWMGRLAERSLEDPAMPQNVRLECPSAFEGELREALGKNFEAEMQASLQPAPVDLRVNSLRTTRDRAMTLLSKGGIENRPGKLSPWAVRCEPGANVSSTTAFREGLVEFQDEASQVASLLCDVKPGMQVIDFCAGTGGKSLALAAQMGNRGHLVVCDISEVRLARAKQRLKRAGVENAERRLLGERDDKWMKRQHGKFDRVFVDAPCSGTGSWRRNPDLRWSKQAANVDELLALQISILARAAYFVKKGGRLIYATCSLLRRENDDQALAFTKSHPAFVPLEAKTVWQEAVGTDWPCDGPQFLRLSPAQHRTDGFFAAIFLRQD